MVMADREVRRGPRRVARNPKKSRSRGVSLGARSRDRLMTRSCCFRRRFSETSAFAPPGLSSLAIVARMWAKTTNKFSMAGKVRKNCHSAQADENPDFQLEILIRHAHVRRATLQCHGECGVDDLFEIDIDGLATGFR